MNAHEGQKLVTEPGVVDSGVPEAIPSAEPTATHSRSAAHSTVAAVPVELPTGFAVDESLLEAPLYGLPQAEKERRLAAALASLTAHHREACPSYRRLTDVLHPRLTASSTPGLADIPYLPVGLFKSHRLVSVPQADISTTLTSSGTTGQQPSQIFLDKATAHRQTRALAAIMSHILGPRRLPMLIIDTSDLLKNRVAFSARGAGVLGMMTFGAQPRFALDPDMRFDRIAVEEFLIKHGGQPFLIFGFTFMVWVHFFEQIAGLGIDLSNGILVHSGGWKKLVDRAVDNATFKAELRRATGLRRVYNFYGMVEQVGSVFLEGEDGLLYPPAFADIIVRDPDTMREAPPGEVGVIQTVSMLPTSYPGHSLLTEDLGVIERIDQRELPGCGRLGKAFRVVGRVPRAELRGCSDTHAEELAATGRRP
jgi:Acyl-protein synthetase, LuxE